MNLLQLLSQSFHPMHKTVSVVNDKNIRSGLDGREMVIYSEDRSCLEMLAHEIIFATMLFEEKKVLSNIVTDVEKIVNNPENYGLYFDTDEEKKAPRLQFIKKIRYLY